MMRPPIQNIFNAAAKASEAFAVLEQSCKEKIQHLSDEVNFVKSLLSASSGQWNEFQSTPTLSEIQTQATQPMDFAPLKKCLLGTASVLDTAARHVQSILVGSYAQHSCPLRIHVHTPFAM